MSKVNYSLALAQEYSRLYKSCEAKSNHFDEIDDLVDQIIINRPRYENVADILGIPWYFIAAIHNMESSQNFSKHLHNGDALTARTKHVPAGRPLRGTPPFTWEESAIDALKLRRLHNINEWTLARLLYELEGYNWGYRIYHSHVLSPYLWSYSNHYSSGKYIADGRWSDSAKSRQCGAVVIIRRLQQRDEIVLQDLPEAPLFLYSNTFEPYAKELQEFLNGFDGISLRVDGWPGDKTSNAVKTLFGFYLKKDPRNNAL